MSTQAEMKRLIAEVQRRGSLMSETVGAGERLSPLPQYPRLFREFTQGHAFVAFEVGGIRVYGNTRGEEHNWEDLMADTALTRALVEAGFPPFGRPATGSYDRICFDMRGNRKRDDAPVVLMDHESILSRNRIPKPMQLADSLMQLFEIEQQRAKP